MQNIHFIAIHIFKILFRIKLSLKWDQSDVSKTILKFWIILALKKLILGFILHLWLWLENYLTYIAHIGIGLKVFLSPMYMHNQNKSRFFIKCNFYAILYEFAKKMAIFQTLTWYSPPKYIFFSKIFFLLLSDTQTHKKIAKPNHLEKKKAHGDPP